MLQFGGYINILIAIAHIVGLFWAEQMFEVTGIGKEMNELVQIHSSLPYLLTIFVSIVFFVFGLYGLSADDKFRKLPFLKSGIFIIAGVYIFRGLGEILFNISQQALPITETIYSLIALAIGFLFLIGGLKKWQLKKE
ncbi:MAG: hypothetical protein RIC90_00730 [Balneola sp.]